MAPRPPWTARARARALRHPARPRLLARHQPDHPAASYEDPAYVPLLRRAFTLWREIEAASGGELLVTTGSIDAGPEDGPLFDGALASARAHAIPHEVLTAGEVNARYPACILPLRMRVVFQPASSSSCCSCCVDGRTREREPGARQDAGALARWVSVLAERQHRHEEAGIGGRAAGSGDCG